MTVSLDLWHVILLLMAFGGCVASFGKLLLVQVEKRLYEQFAAQEHARNVGMDHWDDRFGGLETAARADTLQWQRIERDLMQFKADMPLHYVRREDYVRGQTVIEAKLDALFAKIENIQLQQQRIN